MPTTPRTARRRSGLSWLRRLGGAAAQADPWIAYQRSVEPVLGGQPRVHRFALPPVLGDPGLQARAVAVHEGGDVPAAAASRAEWIVLVRPGDRLAPLALERLGQAAALAPDAAVLTCDDDLLAPDGTRIEPRFRPGPSPDRWLAVDDSGPLLCVRTEALRALPPSALDGDAAGWRHALALRLAGRDGAGHAHVPLLLCHRGTPADALLPAAALEALLREQEPAARVERVGHVRRVRRPLAAEPTVEAIVPFRDRPELLERCVRSLLDRSTYQRLTVRLVDNGSERAETAALLATLARDPRVVVDRDERPFNYAALNNAAVARSSAQVVVFLNNDTEVIDAGWVEELLEEACRPEVGAVAPMLLFPDGTVQHAGAALGLHGYAGHPFAGLAPDEPTPFGRADEGVRNWLAVTAACMMVEREKLLAVAGFDESFVVAGNDVDLCLRLTARGHRSLCVTHVRLLHDESRSRGAYVDPGDFAQSERSYGAFRTVGDPFYNPSLTLTRSDCGVRTPEEGA